MTVSPEPTPFAATQVVDESLVRLTGELGEAEVPEVLRLLAPLEQTGGVVDLSGLTLFTSLAVGAVVQSTLRAVRGGRHLRLVAAPGCVAASILTVVAVPFDPGPGRSLPRTERPAAGRRESDGGDGGDGSGTRVSARP